MKNLFCKIFGHRLLLKSILSKCENYNANKNRKYCVVDVTFCHRCGKVIETEKTADMNAQSTVSYLLKKSSED